MESERQLLRAHEISRQPRQSEVAQLSWLCHHLAQSFHTELHVESPTEHIHADACVLLTQLRLHLFQLVERFWVTFPETLAAQGALRLCACHGTVYDDRSKVFRIFQPLESLFFDVHEVGLQVLTVFQCPVVRFCQAL